MKIYLVGGAVRDELLGLEVTERDWVVVGATPKEMLKEGFNQVGKSFPVFLHPKTGEEYALARTEKKTGKGYHGFECDASTKVTLEDDLMRRDLTINAIAKDEAGNIIDPFGGQKDLENKILKHVSSAFVEDPVRLLRVARFMARFEPLGFKIDKSTLSFMQEMVELGEVDALVPERVFKEMQRALTLPSPVSFIRTLRATGALQKILPEVDRLYGVPQTPKYHPEIDTGVHTEMVLEQATRLSQDPEVRFAAMLHDVGKGTTAVDILPSHHGHEQRGEKLIKSLCKRLKVPANFRDLAVYVAKFHGNVHRAFELKPSTVVSILERVDAFRRPARFEQFLIACEADSRGRKGFEARDYPQAQYLRDAFVACMEIDMKAILDTNARGDVIKKRIHDARVRAVKALNPD